ncbi:hypothetical protein P4H65_08425 [Paenibacillus chitinolyticus]|uniref:hypothetical protein n=1 Tax=Paenibacillus chitinolyticus TaxID=79263 RepID=UPI002DBA23CF|nr:hypothetical protein [Paenibacillus chitinolyticus]MEC0245820.1 hypothetical protein [Paenibacillus chitinolyticus]
MKNMWTRNLLAFSLLSGLAYTSFMTPEAAAAESFRTSAVHGHTVQSSTIREAGGVTSSVLFLGDGMNLGAPEKDENVNHIGLKELGIFAGILFVIYQSIRVFRQGKRKEKLLREAQAYSTELYRDSERLGLLADLYKGPSAEKRIRPVEAEMKDVSSILDEMTAMISGIKISFIGNVKTMEETMGECRVLLRQYQGVYGSLKGSIDRLCELEKQNDKVVSELQAKIESLLARAKDRSAAYRVDDVEEELLGLQKRIGIIDREQMSDFIDVQEHLAPEREQLAEIERLLAELPELHNRQQKFKGQIGSARDDVNRSIREHGLDSSDLTSFASLDRAEALSAAMLEALNAGRIREAARISSDVTGLIKHSVIAAGELAELRESLTKTLRLLKSGLRELDYPESAFKEELKRVKTYFAESVWSFMRGEFDQFTALVSEIAPKLPEVENLLAEGRFNEGGKKLIALMEQYELAEKKHARLQVYEAANKELNGLRESVHACWMDFQETVSFISSEGLEEALHSRDLGDLKYKIHDRKEMIDRRMSSPPIQLDRLRRDAEAMSADIQAYRARVEQIADQQEEYEDEEESKSVVINVNFK